MAKETFRRLSAKVILRREAKNLEWVSTREDKILREVYPESAEGLRMTVADIPGVVGQPLDKDFWAF